MASDQLTRWDVGKNGTAYHSWKKKGCALVFLHYLKVGSTRTVVNSNDSCFRD